jgi:hypothetical protein
LPFPNVIVVVYLRSAFLPIASRRNEAEMQSETNEKTLHTQKMALFLSLSLSSSALIDYQTARSLT